VEKYGGVTRWADHFGIPLGPRQDRRPYPVDEAVAEANALIREHGRLPGAVRLRALGHSRLAYLVEQAGGARGFCAQHALDETL
jgi:hypothetical protein